MEFISSVLPWTYSNRLLLKQQAIKQQQQKLPRARAAHLLRFLLLVSQNSERGGNIFSN